MRRELKYRKNLNLLSNCTTIGRNWHKYTRDAYSISPWCSEVVFDGSCLCMTCMNQLVSHV